MAVLAQTALIGAALLLCACAKKYLYAHMEPFMLDHDIRYNLMLFQHTISADYEAMESPEGLNQMAQALKNTGSDTSPTRIVVKTMSSFLENSIGIVAYGGILAKESLEFNTASIITLPERISTSKPLRSCSNSSR